MVIHSASSDEYSLESPEDVVSSVASLSEIQDLTLRPQSLSEYIGQKEIKKNLSVFIEASQKRSEPLEHVLLHGAPGLGKTTLANILAREMKSNIRVTSGPALERQGDVASLITNLENGDILFIDEIHRLKPVVEEVLYSAMEDFAIDLILGKGPSARSMRLNLPRFTLIGATTKLNMISSPLRDRFGHVFRLDFYAEDEMAAILNRSSHLLNIPIESDAVQCLALSSRRTPRIANRLLRRIRDFAAVQGLSSISLELVEASLGEMGIDQEGLDETDRFLLRFIVEKFQGGPVGLHTVSAATGEEAQTLEDIYEPFLLQKGFLDRTPRGRIVTPRGYTHLGLPIPS